MAGTGTGTGTSTVASGVTFTTVHCDARLTVIRQRDKAASFQSLLSLKLQHVAGHV
jgi:hypothetical protein